jgi:hypothetical protein
MRELVKGMCFKCKIAPYTLQVKSSKYCKECFLLSIVNSFKSNYKLNEKVAVAFSGGACSSLLMHLLPQAYPIHVNDSLCSESGIPLCDSETWSILQSCPDNSVKEDLVKILRMEAIYKQAKLLGCSVVLFGDCASLIAIRAIASTCKGRGITVPTDSSVSSAYKGRCV